MERLKNKTAIITGGSGSLGRATAKKFSSEGANVVLVDMDEKSLAEAKTELKNGDRLMTATADVTSEADTKKYLKAAKDKFGAINIIFANAGIEGSVKPIVDYGMDEFDKIMAVNVRGVFLALKYGMPHLKEAGGGSIIISSSVSGMQGTAGTSVYTTSKHALIGLMRNAAIEGAKDKIRANTINPSPVDNRMMRSLEKGFSPDDVKGAKKQFEQMIPMGRYAEPEDIANTVLFLASDDSVFTTGTINPIDGGLTA